MELTDDAIVLTLRPHGENGAVGRFLTFANGLRAGYVPGARSRGRRAILIPGNRISLRLRARSEDQLPTASVELLHSRALIAFDAMAAAILHWLTALTATTLAEATPHPALAEALDALLAGLDAGMAGATARAALARYELLLLQETGFGLDLGHCALGGSDTDLAFVSPHSGRAVSRAKATGQLWQHRLLPLPAFLRGPTGERMPRDADIAAALALTGHFLRQHWHFPAPMLHLRDRATGLVPTGFGP